MSMSMGDCRVHKLVADVAVLALGQVLLVRYRETSRYDGQTGWFLLDDYLDPYEHPDEASRRILREQAGIQDQQPRLHHIESFGNGAWHLVFHYAVDAAEVPVLVPGSNVAAAQWFPVSALPDRAAVAHHGWAIDVLQTILGGSPA